MDTINTKAYILPDYADGIVDVTERETSGTISKVKTETKGKTILVLATAKENPRRNKGEMR